MTCEVPEYHYSKDIDFLLEFIHNTFAHPTLLSYLFILCILFLFSYSNHLQTQRE